LPIFSLAEPNRIFPLKNNRRDMKLRLVRSSLALLGLIIVTMAIGCNRQVDGGTSGTAAAALPAPEARFAKILDYFRRKVEDQPVGFVVSDGTSRSTLVGTNTVSSELIRPTKEGEPYKAFINVETRSSYTLHRTTSSEDSEKNQNSKNQGQKSLLDSKDEKKNEFEPDLTGKTNSDSSGSKSNQPGEEKTIRRPDVQNRKYELVYNHDRWSLVTKLDPKTQRSIQFAFEQALASQ
jgi:hypothetical protein